MMQMTNDNSKNGANFWFHDDRDMSEFGDARDLVSNFLMQARDQQACRFTREQLNTFILNKKQNQIALKIYDSLIDFGFESLADAYIEFLLLESEKNPKKCPSLMRMPQRLRARIINISRRFERWVDLVNKSDDRAYVLLSGLNTGVVSTTYLLEDFRSYKGDEEELEVTSDSSKKLERRVGWFSRHYDWYRSALNSLWRAKFLKREIRLLSELNLARGTSIYFTHNVEQRELLDFIKFIVDRSEASKAYSKTNQKKRKRTKKQTDSSQLIDNYSEEEKKQIRRIMTAERISEGKAIAIFEMRKKQKKEEK